MARVVAVVLVLALAALAVGLASYGGKRRNPEAAWAAAWREIDEALRA